MAKTLYYTATSIDGYIADPHHSLEWLFEAAGPAGGEGPAGFATFFADVGAFCMGATTYEWMVAHPEVVRWQDTYGQVPCWVFTHRELPVVAGLPVTFTAGDVAPVHETMITAAAGRNIWLVGGGDLAGQFADRGLLDELILELAPVLLGGGAPLLPRRIPASRLNLTSLRRSGQFARLTYSVGPAPAATGASVDPPSSGTAGSGSNTDGNPLSGCARSSW
jgi:dihydrofolate reductase